MINSDKVLIVGEDNPYGADPEMALYHRPRNAWGNRLREILELTDVEYSKIKKVNLCEGKWRIRDARFAAAELRVEEWDLIILCGRKASTAWGFKEKDLPSLFFADERQYFLMPHPSGLNRYWGDPESKDRVRFMLSKTPLWHDDLDYETICEGVKDVVRTLRSAGIYTTDSGDGSNFVSGMEYSFPYPHVSGVIPDAQGMVEFAELLRRLYPDAEVEVDFNPKQRPASLFHLYPSGQIVPNEGSWVDAVIHTLLKNGNAKDLTERLVRAIEARN